MLALAAACGDGATGSLREDMGGDYPFTVQEAVLVCQELPRPAVLTTRLFAVWVEVGERHYPLNGIAKSQLSDLLPAGADIRDVGEIVRSGASTSPVIDKGLELCGA